MPSQIKKLAIVVVVAMLLFIGVAAWSNNAKEDMATSTESTIRNQYVNQVENPEGEKVMLDDCSVEIPLEAIDDSTLNHDRTVSIYWFDSETQENVKVVFPFEPKTDFAGCSESVKTKLRQIKEVAKESYGSEYEELFLH